MTDGTGERRLDPSAPVAEQICRFLELGAVVYLPRTPFSRSSADAEFLLQQNQQDAAYHKNIAYRPAEDRLTGLGSKSEEDKERLRRIMRDFSGQVQQFVKDYLSPYWNRYSLDFASFRPIEENGRKMRLRARNDLLHVDSFPTRPVYGNRILRVFENVSTDQLRVWRTSDTFPVLAEKFRNDVKSPADLKPGFLSRLKPVKAISSALGFTTAHQSVYDSWMLNFHNFLKENAAFQANCRKDTWELEPGSSWLVYTDYVSHSVLSGRFALEQTFIVSQDAMVAPEHAPVNVLRRLYGQQALV
jgi:hypothetical protein